MLSKNTGQPYSQIEKDAERDYFMGSEEAKKYGLIDDIIKQREFAGTSAEKNGKNVNGRD